MRQAPKSLSPFAKVQAQTLTAIHSALFAPRFRALETYAQPPAPNPSLTDVARAARMALAWHRGKEIETAAALAALRARCENALLIDEAAQLLAYHREECERLTHELSELEAQMPVWGVAAE
jgi:hypothetical protein